MLRLGGRLVKIDESLEESRKHIAAELSRYNKSASIHTGEGILSGGMIGVKYVTLEQMLVSGSAKRCL